MRSVELFAGCGGLALGVARAGFRHALVVERDADASVTLRKNKERNIAHFAEWPLLEGDVRDVDYSAFADVDLVAGGPPCQPFSVAGKQHGPGDRRNMWAEAIRAVRELRPRAFLFENVAGLLQSAFAGYLDFIKLQLAWPEVVAGRNWRERRAVLRRHARSNQPSYVVACTGINVADYGAPQKRHRAIIVGIRADVSTTVPFPRATHSREALLWSQRVTNSYWERHGILRRPAISEADRFLLERVERQGRRPQGRPWLTVRDAFIGLSEPRSQSDDANHVLHPGARAYPPKHTGSPWDEPAKALKAGSHGVPGGENMLALGPKRVRYFTLREMARLQGFPDDFIIDGTWAEPIRQLGNAVPVQLGFAFASALRTALDAADKRGRSRGRAA